ncbi:MAG TPA: YihY/virulence factor BrkB family protein [Chloroflexota bacterium]|nr:YihY/virulence factor BrkB family protein [Chloroflexota bacterium]
MTAQATHPLAGPAGPVPKRSPWWRIPLDALVDFWRDNAMGMSGMIGFFAFLSLLPLLILLLAFAGDFSEGRVSAHAIQSLFHSVMPGLTQYDFLHTYWDPVRHSRVATRVLGVVSLLAGSMGLHDAVDWAVNRIWESPRHRSFWINKLRGLAVIVWVIVFSVSSLGIGWLWAVVLGAIHIPVLANAGWLGLFPALILDAAIFAALYKLTPTVDIRVRPAIVAGIVGAALWEVSKVVFGWWVLTDGYNRVYGPLAASVIVMLWLWVSSMIFLYGAALSHVLQERAVAGALSES